MTSSSVCSLTAPSPKIERAAAPGGFASGVVAGRWGAVTARAGGGGGGLLVLRGAGRGGVCGNRSSVATSRSNASGVGGGTEGATPCRFGFDIGRRRCGRSEAGRLAGRA